MKVECRVAASLIRFCHLVINSTYNYSTLHLVSLIVVFIQQIRVYIMASYCIVYLSQLEAVRAVAVLNWTIELM
jgi:hypothetical protein